MRGQTSRHQYNNSGTHVRAKALIEVGIQRVELVLFTGRMYTQQTTTSIG